MEENWTIQCRICARSHFSRAHLQAFHLFGLSESPGWNAVSLNVGSGYLGCSQVLLEFQAYHRRALRLQNRWGDQGRLSHKRQESQKQIDPIDRCPVQLRNQHVRDAKKDAGHGNHLQVSCGCQDLRWTAESQPGGGPWVGTQRVWS